ncbi:hypothetical protein [Sporomusa malonica]|uniref:Uncharacterized protein n=1 Tax=Sporomusa malonica TaxID=112901 RepID=A0A1W2DRS8_9FIRM|nr:hypothetical protein [Sporomusa malonica]SMC99706.1 hypothetical protein SAMN04488500_11790 [Sporomusa malonica]
MPMSVAVGTKNRLPSTTYPLPANRLFLRVQLHSRLDVKSFILQNSLYRREVEVCQLVEECQNTIRQYIAVYFKQCTLRVAPFIDQVFLGRKKLDLESFDANIFSPYDMTVLEKKLSEIIEKSAEQCFRIKPFTHLQQVEPINLADFVYITCLFREYRRTMTVTEVAAMAGNKLFRECVSCLNVPMVISQVAEQIQLGDVILRIVGCSPPARRESYQQIMINQVAGLLESTRRKLVTDTCLTAAKRIYELYDLVGKLNHEKNVLQLKNKLHATGSNHAPSHRKVV